jgi:xylan 1,4-beta-xylosidase
MLAVLIILGSFGLAGSAAPAGPQRFCNPIPLPNYPVGKLAREIARGQPTELGGLWVAERTEQYRELADPSALWFEGKWYLYPSVDLAWVSADEGRTWQHHPLNVRDAGYAPTVVHHRGRFLLMASESALYAGPTPLGPFEAIGTIALPDVPARPPRTGDPMLFSDEDGRLYFYWGCTPNSGIWGVELDPEEPTRVRGEPRELIPFRPDTFVWERLGNHDQNPHLGWMEGAWMLRHGGRYYLTYSAGGTQYRTYSMGCYVSDSPLGPFEPQRRNPIFRTTDGLVTGTAHGCIVPGPQGKLWTFYSVYAGAVHGFERRLGLDVAEIDEHGELLVPRATTTPQALPGAQRGEEWLPLNDGEPTFGSSLSPNTSGRLAVDNSMLTWWQPAGEDRQPQLTTHFSARATIHAVRIIWRDVGLDTTRGAMPGAFRYRVEAETERDQWTTIIDRRESVEDLLIDYRECAPTSAIRARLVVVGWPSGIQPAVAEFTVFGVTDR